MMLKSKKGFTLIEIMLTITVSIVSLLFLVHFAELFHHSLVRHEAEKILELFHLLHHKAQAEQCSQKISFNTDANSYSANDQKYILHKDVQWGAPVSAQGPPSAPVHAIRNPITFPDQTVTFFENGSISSGTIYITNKKRSICYAITTPISSVSYIRLYNFNDSTWYQVA